MCKKIGVLSILRFLLEFFLFLGLYRLYRFDREGM